MVMVNSPLFTSWKKIPVEPVEEVEGPDGLVDKVRNEDDGDTDLGRLLGHVVGFKMGMTCIWSVSIKVEVDDEGDAPDGEDELHEQHHRDCGQVPRLLGVGQCRIHLNQGAPEVQDNVETTEKVEAGTVEVKVGDQESDKKNDQDKLVKDDKLLNFLFGKPIVKVLEQFHLL